MPANALAKRLGVRNSSSILRYETAERDDAITLATLRKVATALDCELHYMLVPKKPLRTMLEERAAELARKQYAPISHHMALENQAVLGTAREEQLALITSQILAGSRRDLWK